MSMRYVIQKREAGLKRYRIVRIDDDGDRKTYWTFWTKRGARYWIACLEWEDLPE